MDGWNGKWAELVLLARRLGGAPPSRGTWSGFHSVKTRALSAVQQDGARACSTDVRHRPRVLTGRGARGLLGLALGGTLCGCQPTRESLTAGHIGCPPSEVVTTGVSSSSGWNQSAETWMAECRGRRFVCTEVTTSSFDGDWLFTSSTDSVDSDVSCREELAPVASQAAADTTPVAPAMATSAPPTGGAGFELGMSRTAAREVCEAADHHWEDDSSRQPSCTGPAAALGFPAEVQLTFCKPGLCGISVSHVPEEHWMQRFMGLRRTLETKYGAPSKQQVRVPSMCRTDEDFDRCARDGTLRLSLSWQWPTGQRMRLSLGQSPHAGENRVLLTYVHAAPLPSANAAAF